MKRILLCMTAVAAVAACSTMPSLPIPGGTATATLSPRSGSTVQGTVNFSQRGDKVFVTADVSGLKPNAEHGFHVHEKGDCSAADATSTGGHFNPTGKIHGALSALEHHGGDMQSLKADATGHAVATFEMTDVTLGDGPKSLIGKGVIVHRDPDDFRTQPTGNSGARIACGVIVKNN